MKKIFIFLFALIILTSCGSSEEIEAAKQAMLNGETSSSEEVTKKDPLDISDGEPEQTQTEAPKTTEASDDKSSYNIEQLSDSTLLKFNNLSVSAIEKGEVEISGETLGEVERITVGFSNANSDYPDDLYTLKTFKSGGKDFKYIASSRFKVLDFGENTYIFTAHTGRESVETRVTINLKDTKSSIAPKGETEKLIGTEVSAELSKLPTGGNYGNPVMLGEAAFTYSDINGLEVKKTDIREVSCESLTDYLSNNINTWYYWNTCRDLLRDKVISFYVLRINGEEYVYQKHYVDFINSFYATYDIETGTGVTKENIAEKNKEFKERNDSFSNISLTDNLFKDIVK